MVKYVKSMDDKHGQEFLLCDYPYIDGNDLLADIFVREFGAKIGEKIDGLYYILLKVYLDDAEYVFQWHEDIGNLVYAVPQTPQINDKLEKELSRALEVLNGMLKQKKTE